jgi:hypothetical protein
MPKPAKDGFPAPLFDPDDPVEVEEFFADTDLQDYGLTQLLNFNLGRLRSSDPILGDLTVSLKEAYAEVSERVFQLRNP